MARTPRTPGKPTAVPEEETGQTTGEDQTDPTPLIGGFELGTKVEGVIIENSNLQEQLDRIESKLDALLEQGGVAVKETKRWRHDPKRGHVFE